MTFEKIFVTEKLEEISKYLKETKELFRFSDKDILSDSGKTHIAERLFQLIVDTILDVNYHFIRELDLKISEDLQGTFYTLRDNQILSEEFANKVAPVVGLRNRIVHRYDSLDKKLFIETFRKNCSDFEMYINLIVNYLKSNNLS